MLKILVIIVGVLMTGFSHSQDFHDEPAISRHDLPNVLLIGDSISIGYLSTVREELLGKANVYRIKVNGQHTDFGRKGLRFWLAGYRWDVIHFNFGLHDIILDERGLCRTPDVKYDENLRVIVKELNETSARVIWATTTPVPAAEVSPPRRNADVERYNAIARPIMSSHGIMIDDLYHFISPRLIEAQLPHDVHYTDKGSALLGKQVASVIASALPSVRQ